MSREDDYSEQSFISKPMSWLLFMDESGHDHKHMPYEVRGGIAVHAGKVWPLFQAVQTLEQATFGAFLRHYDSELKGSKLLQKERFEWEQQGARLDEGARRKHALNFLNSSKQGRSPRRIEFTAYGQACIEMAEKSLQLLGSHDAKLFASIIPKVSDPGTAPAEFLRKDHVFLFERFACFLREVKETGVLIMDGTEKNADRGFVGRIERYFIRTSTGKERTQWIVPAPLFVESDMTYGVQLADLCIYCLNWGYRSQEMNEPIRNEIEPFVWLLEKLIWSGDSVRDGRSYRVSSVVFVPDPYHPR